VDLPWINESVSFGFLWISFGFLDRIVERICGWTLNIHGFVPGATRPTVILVELWRR
jgi:hypothetical protein